MASKDLVDIPTEYLCLLTKEMMEYPTLASDGKNYEKDAIEKYINEHKKSPVTGEPLQIDGLKQNEALRKRIVEFKEEIPKIIAAKFREKMLGDFFGFKQEEEKLDTVQNMMGNLNIKEKKENPEREIGDFDNKNLLKFSNKELVLPPIQKVIPEELAKRVNLVFEEDVISPNTIAEILETGAEVAREKYVILTLENRKKRRGLFKNDDAAYAQSIIDLLNETENLINDSTDKILELINIPKETFEESCILLMEKGFYQELMMIQASIRQAIKNFIPATKQNISLTELKPVLEYQLDIIKKKPEFFNGLIELVKKDEKNFELIPLGITTVLEDLIYEKYEFEVEDQIQALKDPYVLMQDKAFTELIMQSEYAMQEFLAKALPMPPMGMPPMGMPPMGVE